MTSTAHIDSARQTVHVSLEDRAYDILVERGVLDRAGDEIARHVVANGSPLGRTAAILVNPKIDRLLGDRLRASLVSAGFHALTVAVTPGETYKNLATVSRIYDQLYADAVDRRTIVIALGGGVIGDVAGFVAASYQRGLDFVQIPTTIIAQVDSSVGGKVGVNFRSAKNLVGAFHQPRLVLIDPNTLKSLPMRQRRSGLAEIIKHGIIADADMYAGVASEIDGILSLKSAYLDYAVANSCRIKARVVESDERDHGPRATLNFGHTIGHALEAITRYRVYTHGEAIAIGMVSASLIAEEMGVCDNALTESIANVLRRAGFEVKPKPDLDIDEIIALTSLDKKSVSGSAKFVLVPRIGHATYGNSVPAEIVRAALKRQSAI
jgi:3-dehydroquinate synthase